MAGKEDGPRRVVCWESKNPTGQEEEQCNGGKSEGKLGGCNGKKDGQDGRKAYRRKNVLCAGRA